MALDIFGDRWSLLVLRDMIFSGACHFGTLAAAEERISTNVLSERLARLMRHGMIVEEPDPAVGRKTRYVMTEKGWQLAPVLAEIILWSGNHHQTASPAEVLQAIRSDRAAFIAALRAGHKGENDR